MKKEQAVKFWEAIRSTTSMKNTLASFENKKAYGSKRTLERWAQAFNSFQAGDPLVEVMKKTSWSMKRIKQLHKWWDEFFGGKAEKVYATFLQLEKHRQTLLDAIIPELNKLEVYPITLDKQEYLVHWWTNAPDYKLFQISGGKLEKDGNGKINICLPVEETTEWKYLLQHLPDDSLANKVKDWKNDITLDLIARFSLLQYLIDQTKSEIKLEFVPEIRPHGSIEYSVYMSLPFMVYFQVFYKTLGIRTVELRRENFSYTNYENGKEMVFEAQHRASGLFFIDCPDSDMRDMAISYAIAAQHSNPPQAQAAKHAYLNAQKSTRDLKQHADAVRLAVAFPEGSSCDACRLFIR